MSPYIRIITIFIIRTVLILLLSSDQNLCQEDKDYWISAFDEEKNCEKEELIKTLMEQQNPSRCASRSIGNHHVYIMKNRK